MGTNPRRILVAVSDPEQLPDLVGLACALAGSQRNLEIHALHVLVIPRTLPVDAEMQGEVARGEALLAKAEEVAEARGGRRVRTDLLQAREAGPAILEEINEKSIDTVVLGSCRRRAFGERAFGDTVEYVTKRARCRVVIAVPPEPAARVQEGGHP